MEDQNMLEAADLTDEESSTTSSEEDEQAEKGTLDHFLEDQLITEDVENGFFKVLNQLKNKDPQLYKEEVKYFTNETEKQSKNSSKNKTQKLQDKKKIYDNVVQNESDVSDNFWTAKNLNKDDQFLRDYILNKKFLRGENMNMKEELRKLKEEEKELEEEAIFEYKFNNRYEEKPDEEFAKKYPHTLGRLYEGIAKSDCGGMQKETMKGLRSSSLEENGIRKKDKLSNSKRKLDDVVKTQSKKVVKNKKMPKLVPNVDLTLTQNKCSESIKCNQFKKVQKSHIDPKILENVDANEPGRKKEVKIKNEDPKKLARSENGVRKIGNVKLKKQNRYKFRRNKSVVPTGIHQSINALQMKRLKKPIVSQDLDIGVSDETLKKVLLKSEPVNHEKLATGKPAREQETIKIKKRKRKRSCKKPSGESIGIGLN